MNMDEKMAGKLAEALLKAPPSDLHYAFLEARFDLLLDMTREITDRLEKLEDKVNKGD